MDAVLDAEVKDTLRLIALHETGERYVQEMFQKCTNPEHKEDYGRALQGIQRILRDLREELRVKEGLIPIPIGLELPERIEAQVKQTVVMKHERKEERVKREIEEVRGKISEEKDPEKVKELKSQLSRLVLQSLK